MNWYKVFNSSEEAIANIALNSCLKFIISETEILVFYTKSGFWALENKCPHQDLPLEGGVCIGKDIIECPFHFMHINIRTGAAGRYKAAKSFAVQVRKDGVFVEV